jgi:hypothetical protein
VFIILWHIHPQYICEHHLRHEVDIVICVLGSFATRSCKNVPIISPWVCVCVSFCMYQLENKVNGFSWYEKVIDPRQLWCYWHHWERSDSGEHAKLVMLCMRFLTCFYILSKVVEPTECTCCIGRVSATPTLNIFVSTVCSFVLNAEPLYCHVVWTFKFSAIFKEQRTLQRALLWKLKCWCQCYGWEDGAWKMQLLWTW